MISIIFSILLAFCASEVFSQDKVTDKDDDKQKSEKYNTIIYKINGERIRGTLVETEITIKTQSGEIKVPINELAFLDFVTDSKQVSARAYLHLLRGRELMKAGFDDEALEELKTAISQSPEYKDALFELGKLYYKQNKKNDAMEIFARVINEEPDQLGIDNYLKDIADWYLINKKDNEKAADTYLLLFTKYPQDKNAAFASYKAGFLYAWELKNNQKAITTLESATKAFPNDTNAEKAIYELGRLYMEEGNLDLAENAFNKVISSFPSGERRDNAHFSLAMIYQRKKQYSKAMQEIDNVMRISNDEELITQARRLIDELAWNIYDTSEGLPSNDIRCIALDKNYIWVGTPNGIAKFDKMAGLATEGITIPNIDVVSLAVDDSYLWIGTSNSWIKKYDKANGKLIQDSPIRIQGDLPKIFSMCVDKDSLWVGTEFGIYQYYEIINKWEHYTISNGLSDNMVLSLASTPKGIWCGTPKGACIYDYSTGNWNIADKQSKLVGRSIPFISYAGNNIWFAWYSSLSNGVSRYDPTLLAWREWTITEWDADADSDHLINSSLITVGAGANEVWVGTDTMTIYYNYRNSQWSTPLSYPSQLAGHTPYEIAVDGESVWFATSVGLGRLNRKVLIMN
jgi:tetratricopeptide (TPR) repeat protein